MFFNRGCNRGKSKLVIQDYKQEFLPDGQRVVKRVKSTINILSTDKPSTSISEESSPSDLEEELVEENDNDCYDDIFLGEAAGPSHYKKSRLKAASHWQEIRTNLIKVSLKREGFFVEKLCNRCQDGTARFRCLDCGGFLLCESCCLSIHNTENILHCPETWKDGKWEQYSIPKKICTFSHDPECKLLVQDDLTLILIDEKGRHHDVLLPTCSCAAVIETLVSHRFWPATPCSPTMAFSFDLLIRLQALMFECHISVYDFVKHLSVLNNDTPFAKNRNIYEQLRESFEEFRYHYKSIDCVPVVGDDEHLKVNIETIKCPSCPDQSENADVFLSADACFGLPRKRSGGESYQDPLSSDCYFLDQNKVDQFIDEYPTKSKKSDTFKSKGEDCCSDFQAGSVIRSKGRYIALDETAVFGIACRHAFPWKFLNLKGGERIGYMVYMMRKVVNDEHFKNNNIKLMYDICCQLEKHLRNQDQSDLLCKVDLACPQFHAYAHAADCQVRYAPRRLPGWGLCDGEVMERLWSYLGKFKKMTKEMSSIHRQDILTDALHFYALHQKNTLVISILHRHKNAVKVQQKALETITEIQDDYSSVISQEVIQKWLEKEKTMLMKKDVPKASFEGHDWIVDYFKLLRKFYVLRESLILEESDDSSERQLQKLVKQLVDVEKTHKIPVRWKPGDQPYQNALVANEAASAKSSLDLLRMRGRRRWFLLSLVKKYADGQAQAYRIMKAISKESTHLKKLLRKFNASVQILKEHGHSLSTLSWEQVTNVSSSSLYTSGGEKAGHTLVPDAIKRELVDAYGLCQRAGEELSTLYQEMARVIGHLREECNAMEVALQKIPSISSSLWAGLRSIILRKLDFRQRHLLFAVNSFQPFIEIPVDIQNYLENGNFVISSNQLLNDEIDESDAIEDVNSPISPNLLLPLDEKDDYFFRDDSDVDSGFLSAGEYSIFSSQQMLH